MPGKHKHWYMKLNVAAVLADVELGFCDDETWGIWFKALLVMHMRDRCGQLVGTIAELARACRTSEPAMERAIEQVAQSCAADVSVVQGIITLCNRRMRSEYLERKACSERVLAHRERARNYKRNGECNTDVTSNVTLHSNSNSNSNPPTPSIPEPQKRRRRPTRAEAHQAEIDRAVVESQRARGVIA